MPSRSSDLPLSRYHLAAVYVGRLGLQASVAAQAAPQIAVAVDPESVQRPLVRGVDQLGPAPQGAVRVHVITPDTAIWRALPFDDVELLFIWRERKAVWIEDIGGDCG
jgi:hypothetical protein